MPLAEQQNETLLERITDALSANDLTLLGTLLDGIHPADIADLLESLPPEQRDSILERIDADELGEVLQEYYCKNKTEVV